MSDRTLRVVVILVSAFVGALLAVGVIAPVVFHGVGGGAAFGSAIVGELTAMGSASAAVAAVWVALHADTVREAERRQERDAADEAEARSIIVEPSRQLDSGKLQVKVGNFGTRSILDVELTRVHIPEHGDPIPDRRIVPVVAPSRDSPRHDDKGNAQFAGGIFLFSKHTQLVLLPTTGDITATVKFRDVRGKTWETTFMATTEDAYRLGDLIKSTERQSFQRVS